MSVRPVAPGVLEYTANDIVGPVACVDISDGAVSKEVIFDGGMDMLVSSRPCGRTLHWWVPGFREPDARRFRGSPGVVEAPRHHLRTGGL